MGKGREPARCFSVLISIVVLVTQVPPGPHTRVSLVRNDPENPVDPGDQAHPLSEAIWK